MWSCRCCPTPGRSTCTSTPAAFNTSAGPTPLYCSTRGLPIAPLERMTSLRTLIVSVNSSLLCSSTQPISASAPALLQRTSKDVHLCQVLALFFLTLTYNFYSSSSLQQTCLTINTQLIVRDRAPMDTSNNRNTEAMEEDYNIHAAIGDLPQAPTRSYGNGFRA